MTRKHAFSTAMLVSALCIGFFCAALPAAAQGYNEAFIYQFGDGNAAVVYQQAQNSRTVQYQLGSGNQLFVYQSGEGNAAVQIQEGQANAAFAHLMGATTLQSRARWAAATVSSSADRQWEHAAAGSDRFTERGRSAFKATGMPSTTGR